MEHGAGIQIGKPYRVERREFREFVSRKPKQEMQITMVYDINHSAVAWHGVLS